MARWVTNNFGNLKYHIFVIELEGKGGARGGAAQHPKKVAGNTALLRVLGAELKANMPP